MAEQVKITTGYVVKVEPVENDYNYRNRLIITDSSGERDYWDGGEPEDNSFIRDWSWVADELRNAYLQGRADAAIAAREGTE
jgi:hypothetical protein